MKINKLTNEEYNVLQKISSKSKMDCWFCIGTTPYEPFEDYILDLEENKTYSLKDGILMLDNGLTDLCDYKLTAEEKSIYLNLIKKLKGE